MKNRKYILMLFLPLLILTGCSGRPVKTLSKTVVYTQEQQNNNDDLIKMIIEKYKNQRPRQWGEKVDGVKRQLDTRDKVIALTFDACGGKGGSGYDSDLINFLIKERVKATLFINSRWIDANYNTFMTLSKSPLFEIENHGLYHRPLSVTGRSVYGIKGTDSVEEVVREVLDNERKIEKLTGRKPKFFRSGTAYYDEVAVKIANDLGEEVVNFNVLGDAGATFTENEVKNACLRATPGSIIILHMNHPEKDTAEGVKMAVPELMKMGFRFVKLEEYPLK